MDKRLNTEKLNEKMVETGLNQAELAKHLKVSRESVSKWFKGVSMPKPDKLVRLALLVNLRISELLIRDTSSKPVIAFRKKGSATTTESHISRAEEMGMLLRGLVKYLPFDQFNRPATLKNPSTDYGYLQSLVSKIRAEMGVGVSRPIDFRHLLKMFADTQTVLIPVLWGKKGNHENALHIFLPDSTTTWVYLNLDVEVHDFKFWMAHELGHVMASELRGNAAEDFADDFAGALLMPESAASKAYADIVGLTTQGKQINKCKEIAEEFLISPNSVYIQANHYAKSKDLPLLKLEPSIHGACKNLSMKYFNVSESLFDNESISATNLINYAKNELQSPFFDAMSSCIRDTGKGPGFIQSVLAIPAIDAVELHRELA